MRVREVIAALQQANPDAIIYIGATPSRKEEAAVTMFQDGLVSIESIEELRTDRPFVVICGIGELDIQRLVRERSDV